MKRNKRGKVMISSKKVKKYSNFALSEIGPVLADLITIIVGETYIYRERSNDKYTINSEIVRKSDNALEISFGEFADCKWPTYSFCEIVGDNKVNLGETLQYGVLKQFMTYVIAYKIKYGYLYLDESELKRLERKFINRDRMLRTLEKVVKMKCSLETKIEQQKIGFVVEPKTYKLGK